MMKYIRTVSFEREKERERERESEPAAVRQVGRPG
jgi:hypothetical protein